MKKQLKQAVRVHIGNIELSEAQFHELDSMMRAAEKTRPRKVAVRALPWTVAGVLAVFLLTFVLTPVFIDEAKDMPRLIAEEVAKNHLKMKPLEVSTDKLQEVRDYFDKLDFVPVESGLFKQSGLELLGGRYCSVQGITAAQLRASKPGNDRLQTLYQLEYDKSVFNELPNLDKGEEPLDVYAKGIKVRIWVEKGLLFALTEDITSTGNNN